MKHLRDIRETYSSQRKLVFYSSKEIADVKKSSIQYMKLCVYEVKVWFLWNQFNMGRDTIQDLDITCRKKI